MTSQKVNYSKYFDLDKIIKKIHSYLEDFDEKAFLKAFELAEKAHRGQLRKDGKTPYLYHPMSVVDILTEIHADQDILISALLHDVPEDTEHTLNEINDTFGPTVAFLVDGITKLSVVRYQHEMTDSKIESLKKLFLHTAKDPRVLIIKLADRLHNMQTLEFIRPDKQARTARETLEIYVPTANLIGIHVFKSKLEDLCFQYLFPTEYLSLQEKVLEGSKKFEPEVNGFMKSLDKIFEENSIEAKIWNSDKTYYSIYKKLCTLGRDVDYVYDRVLIKITVKDADACYKALGVIHGKYVPKTDRFKDYIANPKINGYKSLHTIVFGVKGYLTEVHIATEKMGCESDYGIASSFFSCDKTKVRPEKQTSWINKILELEKAKEGKEFLENIKSDILEERIVVFTPKGASIDLPMGASAIDFAYAISSSIGNKAIKAIVNGDSKPLTVILRAGDVAKISIKNDADPELYWLNFAKTNFARNKIKSYFKKISKKKKIRNGASLLQREFDVAGLGLWKDQGFKRVQSVLKKINSTPYKNWEALFDAIAIGEINSSTIVRLLKDKEITNELYSYLNKILYNPSKEDRIVNMKIVANDSPGLATEIVKIVDKNSANINLFKGWRPFWSKYAYFHIRFFVKKPREIGRIFYEIRQVDGVINVTRVRLNIIFKFYFALFFTILVWISNSYLLRIIIDTGFSKVNKLVAYALLYIELFLPVLSVLFLTSILRKYFPLIRDKRLMWITSFTILSISAIHLFTKYRSLNAEISGPILGIGILFAYTYLFLLYRKLQKNKY